MSAKTEPVAHPNPEETAEAAGLLYMSDDKPGYTRKKAAVKGGFHFFDRDGKKITDKKEVDRLRSLAVPPAYTDVWLCPSPRGHIQATGRDARGRKQYRYHQRWRETSDANKYERVMAFAAALPAIRKRVDHDLSLHGLPREKVLATVVKLLETTLIRVGNEEYARDNKHYGLTTMRNRHVHVKGATIEFAFRGKSGIDHTIELQNPKLAKVVRSCLEIPGQELFQFLDHDDQRQSIDSADVNAYIHEIAGEAFTAKDFRTWAGTVLAAMALREFEAFDTQSAAKKNIVSAIEHVAERLGNTPSVCRKCYVHPLILESYVDGSMLKSLQIKAEKELTAENLHKLKPEEAAVVGLLRERLAMEADPETLARKLKASIKTERAKRGKKGKDA